MKQMIITVRKKNVLISRKFENDVLVRVLLEEACKLAEARNCSVLKQLADAAIVRQIFIRKEKFVKDEDGLVFSKDYLSYPENGEMKYVYFNESTYHSSLAKAAEIANVVDVRKFFRSLEASYRRWD